MLRLACASTKRAPGRVAVCAQGALAASVEPTRCEKRPVASKDERFLTEDERVFEEWLFSRLRCWKIFAPGLCETGTGTPRSMMLRPVAVATGFLNQSAQHRSTAD